MSYLRHDPPALGHPQGGQRHNSSPLADRHYGGIVSASDFEFDYHECYGIMPMAPSSYATVISAKESFACAGATKTRRVRLTGQFVAAVKVETVLAAVEASPLLRKSNI